MTYCQSDFLRPFEDNTHSILRWCIWPWKIGIWGETCFHWLWKESVTFWCTLKEMISMDHVVTNSTFLVPYSKVLTPTIQNMSAWQYIPLTSVKSEFTQQKKISVHFYNSYHITILYFIWCCLDMEPRFPFYPRLLGLNSLCTTKDCLTNKQKNKERGAPDLQAIFLRIVIYFM